MIKAKSKDKTLICELLSSSFSDNPSVNYILNGQTNKSKRIRALMDYSYEQCARFGEVWLSEDRKACALLLFPQKKRLDFYSIWLDLKLIVQAVGVFSIGHA
ncbi:MAG: N-acetyltransferase, partial [Pedobacter sp.]